MADPFHYPPELIELLIDTIPRLVKGKASVLDVFTSAGVDASHTQDLRDRVRTNPDGINKFEIARTVIGRMNAAGDPALRSRRELVKRVTEWEDFSTCWDNQVLEAKGRVAEIRRVVNVKDSFTRMAQERERERDEKRRAHEERIAEVQARNAKAEALRIRFRACFGLTDPQRRGKELEGILNAFFALAGIGVREAFQVVGSRGEGVIEQIDGVIEINGRLYLVEMKWWSKPLGANEIAHHLVKVFQRAGCAGIVIAHPGLTEPAVSMLRDGIVRGSTVLGVTLEALFRVLDSGQDVLAFFKYRIDAAALDRNPFLDAPAS